MQFALRESLATLILAGKIFAHTRGRLVADFFSALSFGYSKSSDRYNLQSESPSVLLSLAQLISD